jgi:uncharacterized protein YndB with AHSA1/START domain
MEVTRELVVEAEPEEVWEAVTNPERLEEWLADVVDLEAVAGGDAVFRWATGEVRRAVVEEVEEGRLLRLRWWREESPDASTTVAIALDEVESGTRVVVTEAPEGGVAFALEVRYSLVCV